MNWRVPIDSDTIVKKITKKCLFSTNFETSDSESTYCSIFGRNSHKLSYSQIRPLFIIQNAIG